MKLTAILQLYRRPAYLQEQLDAIQNQTIKPDKIIVVHNEGGIDFNYPENVELIYANPNRKFHLRFAIGLLEESEYLVFYDDDTIPGKRWHENCIETIEKHDCLCVTNGRKLIKEGNQYRWSAPGWGNPNDVEEKVDFGGHSWFLKQKNLKYMWFDDVAEYKNGEDIMLSANLQIHGNIPTLVPPHPIDNKELWGSGDNAAKYGSDSVSSWIVNPAHFQERFELIDYYQKKGWKLCETII